ncbi:MAG: tautomerase family protein [Fervidicoccaceae archaeon]
MPIVQITLWPGRDADTKRRIAEGITKVLEEQGIPREAVTIIFYEVPKDSWASGGVLHSDKFK